MYVPPDTPKFHVQQSSYPLADPKTFQSTNQLQGEILQQGRNQCLPAMPTSSRFTPALGSKAQFLSKATMGQAFSRQTNMGPPPTPQRFRSQTSKTSNGTDNLLTKNKSTNHLLPPPSRQKLQNTNTMNPGTSNQQPGSQRFFQISSTSNPRALSSLPSVPNVVRGEHRMPFIPGGTVSQQGFGWTLIGFTLYFNNSRVSGLIINISLSGLAIAAQRLHSPT